MHHGGKAGFKMGGAFIRDPARHMQSVLNCAINGVKSLWDIGQCVCTDDEVRSRDRPARWAGRLSSSNTMGVCLKSIAAMSEPAVLARFPFFSYY